MWDEDRIVGTQLLRRKSEWWKRKEGRKRASAAADATIALSCQPRIPKVLFVPEQKGRGNGHYSTMPYFIQLAIG